MEYTTILNTPSYDREEYSYFKYSSTTTENENYSPSYDNEGWCSKFY